MLCVFLEIDLTNSNTKNVLRMTNAPFNVMYDGNEYSAAGDLLQIDPIDETADLCSVGMLVTLQGVDPSYQIEIENNNFLHAPVSIAYGEIEDNTNVVNEMTYFHRGYSDTPTTVVDYENQTITIGMETQSLFGDITRVPNLMKSSMSNHSAFHNGDKFFEYTADSGIEEKWRT